MEFRTKTFEINTKGRDFFVGDIHGMYDMFMSKLAEVDFDFDVDRIFSVGDLADRGPDPVKCLNLLHKPWFHAVQGNHEDFLLGSHGYDLWCHPANGGSWSLDWSRDQLEVLQDLVRDKTWDTFKVETEFGTIGVVHAESAWDWDENSLSTLQKNYWGRTIIRNQRGKAITGVDLVVVGHTPLKEPAQLANILYIDTGACFEGYLTLLSAKQVFNNDFTKFELQPFLDSKKEDALLDAFF